MSDNSQSISAIGVYEKPQMFVGLKKIEHGLLRSLERDRNW